MSLRLLLGTVVLSCVALLCVLVPVSLLWVPVIGSYGVVYDLTGVLGIPHARRWGVTAWIGSGILLTMWGIRVQH